MSRRWIIFLALEPLKVLTKKENVQMEKALVAFCIKKVVLNCFMDLKMLNETFGKTPCNFLNEKEVDALLSLR